MADNICMSRNRIKILVVGMASSIHLYKYLKQIDLGQFDVRVFPSFDTPYIYQSLDGIRFYVDDTCHEMSSVFEYRNRGVCAKLRSFWGKNIRGRINGLYRHKMLADVIADFKPDVIHAMELQQAGRLVAETTTGCMDGNTPPFFLTVWGSDIYHFRQFPKHEKIIRKVLAACDFFSSDCRRDQCLAREYGFFGHSFPPAPVPGGVILNDLSENRQIPPAKRKTILVKGYQGWAGRALVAIEALIHCGRELEGYEICFFAPSKEVLRRLKKAKHLILGKVRIIPNGIPYEDLLVLFASSRLFIGLSVTDGLPVTFLEALAAGAFPVQSWTSCADEWIEDGVTGILVPPEDVPVISQAIKTALSDDNMVNRAAIINEKTVRTRLDAGVLREKVHDEYRMIVEGVEGS